MALGKKRLQYLDKDLYLALIHYWELLFHDIGVMLSLSNVLLLALLELVLILRAILPIAFKLYYSQILGVTIEVFYINYQYTKYTTYLKLRLGLFLVILSFAYPNKLHFSCG